MNAQQLRLDELNRLSVWLSKQTFHKDYKRIMANYILERVKEIVDEDESYE